MVRFEHLQVGLDDMIQDGTAGLVKAVERFNPEKVRLQSFIIMENPQLLCSPYKPYLSCVDGLFRCRQVAKQRAF